ncbi:ZKSCAN1 [Cordylochernes scorpioides]|uniref:ZKSCAN1 n=1 Tax=Cordylochernes scorpioides TaxID=51811 RepID=A0ABY6KYV1_9ARAC|nr:ZKSCAN1 [Cordylochernes scorpioides]
MPNLILAGSLEAAEYVPERPSFKLQTGDEISPKIGLQRINSEDLQEKAKHANPPAGDKHVNPAAARDVAAPPTAASSSENPADPASLNWADSEMAEVDSNDGYTVVKGKKGASLQRRSTPLGSLAGLLRSPAPSSARQATTNHENYIFVELCPDIPDYSYLWAIGDLVGGPKNITHFGRMNGHYIVGLASRNLASRLVEEGLNIEGTLLKVFPFRKRAERIIVANLPGFVEDATIVQALRRYGDITSIAPIMIKMGEFAFSDGRREAFILLHEGVRLETLPTRLTIHSKGDTLSAFLSFGIKQHHVDIAFVQETNAFHLGSGQDLCLGYNAVVLAHPVAISGSGLACVFGPGVAVIQQRVLWPGHIALATIDVHGEEMTAIAVHLAHEPRERNRQLELLAATAAQEEKGACWIIGDFNIRDRGPSSSSSSDALAALLDLAALVDVATQFDAAHLPTRVAMHGDQVESNRLDRILVPAGVLDRVSIYATSHYHLSDHRLVLLQVGPPTTAVSSPTQPRLAAMLRSGLVLEHLAGYIRELEEDTAHDDDDGILWDRWTTIKAGLLAEARSLHDPRHAASDSYIYRARRYIAAQLEASSIRADYPSLPDLARAIRLRRPVSVIRDEQDNIIEGPELRRRAFATFQPRFARPTSDPAAGAAFIASSAPTTTRELSEEDPLHRPDISPSEIANAIEHLPRGKAPGWDGLPCELLVAFSEDFFAEALARVFVASRLRGALPPSTRRSSICLVPKARGGRGLDGYRPVALPSADYRVLAAILHRRLKPHLRTLVPECQTYAVPGRSPSWNIAMVTDAVEEATALGSPLAVMGVDLESAFDSLDRGFLESLLTSLRLPPAFRAWINILYAGADATIRAGGFHTTAFPLLNGLRQGCAVSAALFSIATGPLLRRLELTFGVGNVIAYADDIVLLFHRDGDFERVATVFEEYKQASGVGVNLRKSAGLWCGAWRNRGDSPLGASWSTTSIRPRRLRLLKLWEEASNILGLNHRAVPTAQLLDLPIIGGCRFLRPPDLLAPARWSGARVRDLIEEENLIARPTRSALADAAALGAFCRRLTSENAVGFGAESTPSSSSLAAAVVLRGTATPFLNGLTTRSARRALDRPRLAATPISRFTSRWSPTIGPPPSRIDWASLRRCAHSGHEADAALKLALHALPHPAHPASVGPSSPACGSIDRSLSHRYWCCPSIRPLLREAFNIIGRPPDLQAWIFGGSGLEDDAISILASAKLRIYRCFVQRRECSAFSDDTEVYSLSSEFEESDEDTFEDEFSDEEMDENQPSPWVRVYTPFSTSKTLTFGEVCGPQHLPPSIIRPIEYFLLFITMNLMKEIVFFTNKSAQTFLASNRDNLPQFSRKLAWKDTTLDEMMAFIGVIFNMGNVRKNQIRDYWSKNELLETPWFGKVMSRGRFELLYSCFSLIDDSNLVPSSHPDYNPTARFEKLIEHVNNKFIYYYKPTQNLRVDESLVCLKKRTRLRQYMPQKHHGRFGVKLWMLCESKTGYCLRMKPYKGKLSPIIKSLSYEVPMNLLQESRLLGKGYHLITDNFFTSINLAKDLLDSHTYLTGTIRINRKGLPKTLTSAKLGVEESLYMVNNNLLALAHKEKKSKPPVKFLSTFCDASSGKKVSDQRDYPQMKICYDSYMGGVDLNDQMLYTYMDEGKGRKFYRKVILNIFHRALLNSFILYEQHTKDNPKLSRMAFNYSVINELVKNHLKPPVLPSTSQEVLEKLPEKRESRCVECTKEGLKRRSRTICSKCKRGLHPVCALKHKC